MFFDPTSFTPLIRLEQALPIPEKIKPLGDIMEAETEMSLPKIVKDRFNRLEKEINEDNLTAEMQIWLKQMGMTKESLKADFIPAKPEKQKLTKHYYHTD